MPPGTTASLTMKIHLRFLWPWLRSSVALVVCRLLRRHRSRPADYQRAQSLRQQYESAAIFVPEPATWIGTTHRFYYRRSLANGFEFVTVDADTQQKQPSFDHPRLADALSRAAGRAYSAHAPALPELHLQRRAERHRNDHRRRALDVHARRLFLPHAGSAAARARSAAASAARCAATLLPAPPRPRMSPDGKWMAFIDNYNVAIRPFGGDKRMALSTDGSEGNYYDGASIAWSPDSSKLAAYRIRPGYRRLVHYVASSPEDQLQPRALGRCSTPSRATCSISSSRCCSTCAARSRSRSTRGCSPNPYDMSDLVWRKDSRALHVRIQPARPPGVPRDRSRRADRRGARGDLRRAEDVFLLQPLRRDAAGRQALSLRPRRRQGSRLDVGARRLEPSLS